MGRRPGGDPAMGASPTTHAGPGMTAPNPTVLFICRHNAGRSPIAAGLARARFGSVTTVVSAGIDPVGAINPVGAEALLERGIDIRRQRPRRVTAVDLAAADVVI